MARLTQRGLVDSIGARESRQYKDKTFVSRAFVIEQPRFDNYTGEKLGSNFIKFEATREETVEMVGRLRPGEKVDVEFIVRGAKYEKKDGSGSDVFTRLEVRGITSAGVVTTASAAQAAPASAPAPAPAAKPAPVDISGDFDPDLGF